MVHVARPRRARWFSRWWLNRSVSVKGVLVLAIPMLALISVAGAGLGLQLQERSERQAATAANSLAEASLRILADAVDAETGVRGYAATSNPVFLEPYTAAAARIELDVSLLRAAATSDADRVQVDVIAATLNERFAKFAEMRSAIQAATSGSALTSALLAGKTVMDQLRAQVAALAEGPSRLADQKRREIARLETITEVVQLAGLVLGILSGLVGGALFTSGISRRVRAAADNADRLGRGGDLLPTASSSDELGRLNRSLTQAQQLLADRLHQLTAARDRALLATQAKNTFLSRTSHELRTPLNAILGFAQLLEMNDLDQDDRDSAVHILAGGRHLLALINELIDTARVESGELKLSMEPVSVEALTNQVAGLMGPLAAARTIDITRDRAHQDVAVFAVQQRLLQVLVNLTSNAVKYNRDGGSIRIGYGPDGTDHVQITVTDTGPGLSAEDIDRIFMPFERLDADQHGIEGTGIGLPLALALTEAMHGRLEVTSSPGTGSTFTVRLPRASHFDPYTAETPPTQNPMKPTPPGPPIEPTTTRIVLSIEDNIANNQVLSRFFQSQPETTLLMASTAQAGIDLAREHTPDLILLDLHLPDLPGEEVLARLRANPTTSDIPVAVLSADATPGTIRRLLARGANDYLTKPLNLRELHTLLDRSTAQRTAYARPDVTASEGIARERLRGA